MTDPQILRCIGGNIKRARLRASMTQKCLAELVGVHWQTISYLESGKYPFAVTTFARICHALEVSPNRMMEGLPEPDLKRMNKVKKVMARKRSPRKATPQVWKRKST